MHARRQFLKSFAIAVASCCGPQHLALARAKGPTLQATKLTSNLTLIEGAGANVVVLNGGQSALLVDGGLPENARELLRFVHRQTGAKRVDILFNTHWHAQHTGANERCGKAHARIIAHENTRLWLGTHVNVEWEGRTYAPLPPIARPNETIRTAASTTFAGETVEYGYLPQAHTDGDLYVFFRNQNVLAAGGVVAANRFPVLDWCTGGWLGGLLQATRTLLSIADENTRIVPGTGPALTRADLEMQQQMLAAMMERLPDLLRKGMSAQEMVAAAPAREFEPRWGDATRFIENAYPGLVGHVRELGKIL